MRRVISLGLLALLLLPVVELAAHARILGAVAPDSDFAAAAAFVRKGFRPRDLVTAYPHWIDPVVRLHAGDLSSLDMVGRSDDAAYERHWVISTETFLPKQKPDLVRDFGRVRVTRFELGPSPVLYDFVDALPAAHVTLDDHACPFRKGGVPRGGGLGKGVLYPLAERFDCDPRRPWLFVGAVVMEDLDLRPRRCIWQHAAGTTPVVTTFDDVPLGDELVLYGGLYYEHERMRLGGPVRADVFIDGERRGSLLHRDGDGFLQLRIPTGDHAGSGARGQVRVEVRADDPDRRSFCWAATTRSAGPRSAPPAGGAR